MGPIDSITWQALTVVLTLVGLVATGLLWRLRGPVAGLRMLAVSLLPAAAYLTGTLRLLWKVGDAVVSWAAGFAFSPVVWLGIALAATSLLLLAVASGLRRRGRGGRPRATEQAAGTGAALPRDTTGRPARPSGAPAGSTSPSAQDDDMTEIEEILKRHGIS